MVVTTTELNTATSTPMILKRVIIDKSKLTEGALFDIYCIEYNAVVSI